MPVIYVDNYRGFKETFIPLKSVNYLVGENSTGKTSILKLIRILSDFKFWINMDFNNEDADLGYFSEIASYSNPKRKDFVIGILGNVGDKESLSAIKMTFVSNEGIPTLSELCFVEQGINVQAKITENAIEYRHNKPSLDNVTEKNKLRYFKVWIENNGLKNKLYKKIPVDESSPNKTYYFVQLIIFDKLKMKMPMFGRMPLFDKDIAWLAPIRTEPQRTYDSYNINFKPDGKHSPYLLKKLLTDTKHKSLAKKIDEILERFGADSGLFGRVDIKKLGKSETAPFELQVYLEDQPIKITSVGYGISQVLPIIIEIISRSDGSWFAIQQPEIHLHPRGQAAFGDLIYKSSVAENKKFIIETHSDYIIDRFRFKINKNKNLKEKSIDSQVLYFNRSNGINQIFCIDIRNDGSYCEDQPKEFREFFIKEKLNLLNI